MMYERLFNVFYAHTGSRPLSRILARVCRLLLRGAFHALRRLRSTGKALPLSPDQADGLLAAARTAPSSFPDPGSFPPVAVDLTIVVPAYNVEAYIGDCLGSILGQATRYSFEVVVVDDGSRDGTAGILDSLRGDPRLVCIRQENRGIASARNRGLAVARGRRLMFVDSDDRLLPGALELLLSRATETETDIVEGGFLVLRDSTGSRKIGRPLWNGDRTVDLAAHPGFVDSLKGVPWGRVYARHLWHGVDFPEGLDYEDTVLKLVVMRRARTYRYVAVPVYEYRDRSSSATRSLGGTPKSVDSLYVVETCLARASRMGMPEDGTLYLLVLHHLGYMLWHRVRMLPDPLVDALLVRSGTVLRRLGKARPDALPAQDLLLEASILGQDRLLWELCCRFA